MIAGGLSVVAGKGDAEEEEGEEAKCEYKREEDITGAKGGEDHGDGGCLGREKIFRRVAWSLARRWAVRQTVGSVSIWRCELVNTDRSSN